MKSSGFSLVELVVVIAVIGVLLSIAVLNFSDWQKKGTIERYVQELYADLQRTRIDAVYTKVRLGVDFSARRVTFRSFSTESDTGGRIITTKAVPVTLTRSSWSNPSADRIVFALNGTMIDPDPKVICFSTEVDARYDALVISSVKTGVGKVINRGAACATDNVIQK